MNKKWRYALIFIMVLWIGIKLLKLYFHTEYTKEEIKGWFEPIPSKYGIKIVYEINDDFFSPLENPPIPAGPLRESKVTLIRHRVLKKYPAILQTAFNKYPVHIIERYLKAIHFAGEIIEAGSKYGGSYDPFRRIVYLVDHGGTPDEYAVSTFHHEFSSLLVESHSFLINPWTNQNPKNFKYLDEIYDNLKEMNTVRKTFADTDCYEKGIVTTYGLTCLENDFSEYSPPKSSKRS
jgi:hypothetical protein